MYRSKWPVLVVVLVGILIGSRSAQASRAPKWTDAQLVELSEVILTGRVERVTSGWDNGAIYTYVTLGVSNVLKGWIPESRVVLKQLGGTVDDLGFFVGGQARFTVGETALVFLEVRPRDETLYTTALWQGKWNVVTDASGQALAVRSDPDVRADSAAATVDSRPFEAFTSSVEALSGAASRLPVGRSMNLMPRETPVEGDGAGQPFTLLTTPPPRWFEFDSGTPVLVNVQASGQPGLAGGGLSELLRAATQWMGVSTVQLASGGASAPGCSTPYVGDGRITISYMDPCGEISNTGGTLAVGGGWFSANVFGTVSGTGFKKFMQGYIVNNDSATANNSLANSSCFYETELHELGHVLGLGHSADSTAIMFPTISFAACSTGGGRSLAADDVAGIQFVYPRAGNTPTGAPGTPLNLTASVNGLNITLTWTAPASGGAVTSYVIEFGDTPTSTIFIYPHNSAATSVTIPAPAGTSGTFYARLYAQGPGGAGAFSNQVSFVIGSTSTGPPGAPSNLAVSVNGLNITFTWSAPSGGGSIDSYVFEFGDTPANTILIYPHASTTTTLTLTAAAGTSGTFYGKVRGQGPGGPGPF